MWKIVEPWQLEQLQRLAALQPERCETFLNTVYRQFDGLYEDLAIMAVQAGSLGVDRAAELLALTPSEVEARVQLFVQQEAVARAMVMVDSATNIARLQSGGVAVWEIVRELRKLGSVERLESSFPSLTRAEIAAALRYAQDHPEETEQLIQRYEQSISKRLASYPKMAS
jgi:uncharacterized protein (DUF433 family)